MRRKSSLLILASLLAACGTPVAGTTQKSSSTPAAVHAAVHCASSTLASATFRVAPSRNHPGVTEFVLPAGGGPTAVAPAGDGAAWVTLEDSAQIIHIDRAGSVIQWKLPHLSSQPGSYAAADGRGGIWFPERGTDAISHLDLAGDYKTCTLPFPAEPIAVSLAADGQVWFADFSGSKAGRMDTNGNVVYWSLAGHLAQPAGVRVAKDETAWISDFSSNALARIGPQGSVSFTRLPSSGGAFEIFLARDGALWIAQEGADRLVRVAAGKMSEITLTSAGSHQPQAITQAQDGSLWFTESRGDRLGHIAPSSTTVVETGHTGQWPDGIAASGATIWFSEYYGQSIGFVDSP
jgi:virginiamycin B lyase